MLIDPYIGSGKERLRVFLVLTGIILASTSSIAQKTGISAPAPVLPVPTPAQLAWHEMELNAFVHFTTNTFTNLEWGNGDEPESVFNPTELNPQQWTSVLKAAGFRQVILTCKHHDGFCLWPSRFTDHSVKKSPYKNGQGDIVKEVSEACKKYGLRFGIYLSPWDRNRADYGTPSYIEYYRNQLKELFTQYGPVFEMWFDGANGGKGYYGGANETRKINGATYYDWPTTLALVRSIQPNVLFFSDAGPGVRWVGNERGMAGKTNWNTISTDTLYAGKAGIEELLNTGSADGNRWVPAEVDVSIRPGWFYHREEDSLVKTPERLFQIYLSSVGRGSTLLLNVPPDRRGLLHENDVKSLQGFRQLLDRTFAHNFADHAVVTATNYRGHSRQFSPGNLTDGDPKTYWATDDDIKTASFELRLKTPSIIRYVVLQEGIALGQRIKAFTVEVWRNKAWQQVASETTIGYKRIIPIDAVKTERIRVNVTDAKACLVLTNVGVY